jgi:NADPH:quinone reductase-like Zn-dependent oxidoreductase
MKAIVHRQYGSTDVLKSREIQTPAIGGDAVLVRVHAAGVNRGDVLALEGIPYAARLTYGLTRPRHDVPGTDIAGRVEAVGRDVAGFQPGDEVFGWCTGAFAEYASARPSMLVAKPAHLSFEHAASVPTAGVAALQALRNIATIRAGDQVLIVGASGGVGTFAVQIAKQSEAEVTGVCSAQNIDLVRSTGADHVIDYTREDYTQRKGQYDLIVDLVGRASLTAGRRALKPNGTYAVVGSPNARSITGMGRFVKALALSPLVPQRIRPLFSKQNSDDLETMRTLLDTGKVLPVIDAVYDLRNASEALQYVGAGHSRGKVVITV